VSIFLRSFLTQVILSSRPKSAGGRFVQGMFNCLSHQLCMRLTGVAADGGAGRTRTGA
jgi:hypothetical protein